MLREVLAGHARYDKVQAQPELPVFSLHDMEDHNQW